jgi:hypothetical protein
MNIYVIKALWRSTSKTLLIRAKNPQQALTKAGKLKECIDVLSMEWVDTRPDDTWAI